MIQIAHVNDVYSTLVRGILYTTFLGTFFQQTYITEFKFPRLRIFFLGFSFPRIYFLLDLFPETLLAILGKKSPRNPKHRTLFPVTFFPRTWENSDFFLKFLFPGFFPETFFPGTILQRFLYYKLSWKPSIGVYPV